MRRAGNCCCPKTQMSTIVPAGTGTLSARARQLFREIELFAASMRFPKPELLSGCRSREQQRELQRRWDAGDRAGLAVRPADESLHLPDQFGVCRAFDLGGLSRQQLETVGSWVQQRFPWARWGGAWLPRDLNHFDVPGQVWESEFTFTSRGR